MAAVLGVSTNEENDETSTPNSTKRLRWATQYKKGKSGNRKRVSILDRLHKRSSMNSEKKRNSGGSMGTDGTDLGEIPEEPEDEADHEEDKDGQGPRTLFFNIPLPADAIDEDGHPTRHYQRNKIRTAKYTPLSFIPKNLWFQFHNIANVYFLFLIILSVSFISQLLYPSNTLPDLQHFRRWESRTERCPTYRYCFHNCCEGFHRRLSKNGAGQ
jgi:phospholipid-translocating ATPase